MAVLIVALECGQRRTRCPRGIRDVLAMGSGGRGDDTDWSGTAVLAYIVMAYIVMAYAVMAYILMVCMVMAYIVTAYIVIWPMQLWPT